MWSHDPTTGERYRLDHPDLLLWVHCGEVDSFLDTTRRAGLPLTDVEADRYVHEQVSQARLIGIAPGDVPASVAELADYFTDVRPALRLTPAAIDAVRFILMPPMPGWVRFATPAVVGWMSMAALGFSLLPRWARRLYAMPGLPTTDFGADLAVTALRRAFLALPAALREGPHYRAAQARLAVTPVRRLDAVRG